MVSVGPVWYWSGMGIYVRILGLGGGMGQEWPLLKCGIRIMPMHVWQKHLFISPVAGRVSNTRFF